MRSQEMIVQDHFLAVVIPGATAFHRAKAVGRSTLDDCQNQAWPAEVFHFLPLPKNWLLGAHEFSFDKPTPEGRLVQG